MEKVQTIFEHYPIGMPCYVIRNDLSSFPYVDIVEYKIESFEYNSKVNAINYFLRSDKNRVSIHKHEKDFFLKYEDALSYLQSFLDKLKEQGNYENHLEPT